ncbi:hypothetical protein PQ610_03135 [Tardisphaera miroshnichenkoae]
MRTRRPAQSTVVGAMFFIVLLFFSLGIFYYLESNYVQYGNAMQSALQLAQQRNNQRFALTESYVYPAQNGFKTLFYVRNEGGVPIDLVNAYLYDEETNTATRYKVNIYVNPGQSLWVNLTKYNSSFPVVLNGYYNVSMWTSLGVGASTLVVATSNGVVSSSSPEGNVFPVPGSTSIAVSNAASVSSTPPPNNWRLRWWFSFWSPGQFAVANVALSFLMVNNNPYPITIYPNTSVTLDWIPTAEQMHALAVEMSAQGSTMFSGTIGAALSINKTIIIPPDSAKRINVTGYNVMFYNLNWYWSWFGQKAKQSQTSQIFSQSFDQLYVPIYPFTTTNYLFAGRVLLSYFLMGKTYHMYLNNGYFNLSISAPPAYTTLYVNVNDYTNYNDAVVYSYSTTPGVVNSGTVTAEQSSGFLLGVPVTVPIGAPISLGAEPQSGTITQSKGNGQNSLKGVTAFYGWQVSSSSIFSTASAYLSSASSINTTLTVYGNNNVLQAYFGSPVFYITSNAALSVAAGNSASIGLTLTPYLNDGDSITNITLSELNSASQPYGIGVTFSPATVTIPSSASNSTVITVNVAQNVKPGSYTVYLEAYASGQFYYGHGQSSTTALIEIWALQVSVNN